MNTLVMVDSGRCIKKCTFEVQITLNMFYFAILIWFLVVIFPNKEETLTIAISFSLTDFKIIPMLYEFLKTSSKKLYIQYLECCLHTVAFCLLKSWRDGY